MRTSEANKSQPYVNHSRIRGFVRERSRDYAGGDLEQFKFNVRTAQ